MRRLNLFACYCVAATLFTSCTADNTPTETTQSRGGSSTVADGPAGGGVVDTSMRGHSNNDSFFGGRAGGQQSARGNTTEGAEYANNLLGTDPEHKFVKDAYVRDNKTLGVIFSPTMKRGEVDQALGSLMRGMQQRFKNYPLQVIAYYESGDEMARTVSDGQNTTTQWKH
jgi:hypothetical protein